MTARRITALIYILLILAVLVHIGVNLYAALGHDVSNIRYMFLGGTESQTYNGELTYYKETGVSYAYLSVPLTLTAFILILWQRNKHPMYYADHMQWQLSSLLRYLVCLIALFVSMLFFFFLYMGMPFLLYALPATLELWFFYRIVRGLICLQQGRSVHFNGAPLPKNE